MGVEFRHLLQSQIQRDQARQGRDVADSEPRFMAYLLGVIPRQTIGLRPGPALSRYASARPKSTASAPPPPAREEQPHSHQWSDLSPEVQLAWEGFSRLARVQFPAGGLSTPLLTKMFRTFAKAHHPDHHPLADAGQRRALSEIFALGADLYGQLRKAL